MPNFAYHARDAEGRLITGVLEAPDERAAAVALGQRGCQPVQIQPQTAFPTLAGVMAWNAARIDRQEVMVLLRQLAALVKAGIPLVEGLDGAIQQTPSPALRRILGDVTHRVQGGSSFSDALAHHPDVFPQLYTSMVRVGEVAGILDHVLAQLAQLGTQELEHRSRIQSALVYPIVLIGFALVVVNVLLIGVLPKFVSVFQASRIALPWPTQVLLGISGAARHFWWLLVLGAAAAVWGARRYYATPEGRETVDRGLLTVPVIGDLSRKIVVARLSRIVGAMLKTGVPLLEALTVAEQTVSNRVFQRILQHTRAAVAEGRSMSETWRASAQFPPLVSQLLSVGERSGQLDTMLLEIADFYEPEIDLTIRKFTTLLEPLLLMVMGLMVGFIALSVLLPIFQLIHVFKR